MVDVASPEARPQIQTDELGKNFGANVDRKVSDKLSRAEVALIRSDLSRFREKSAPMLIDTLANQGVDMTLLEVNNPRHSDFLREYAIARRKQTERFELYKHLHIKPDYEALSDVAIFEAIGNAHETFRLYRALVESTKARFLDTRTGILNKEYLEQLAEERFQLMKERYGSVAVLAFDLDKFKDYNTLKGHLWVDENILKNVGAIFASVLREDDIIARQDLSDKKTASQEKNEAVPMTQGGDELVAILGGLTAHEAHIVVTRLNEQIAIRLNPLLVAEGLPPLTMTVGISGTDINPRGTFKEVLRQADDAQTAQKKTQRGQIAIFNDSMEGASEVEVPRETTPDPRLVKVS